MQAALRASVTTGGTIVGVSIIAASPLAPPLPVMRAPVIQLTSATDSVADLFSGLENDIATLLCDARATDLPTGPLGDLLEPGGPLSALDLGGLNLGLSDSPWEELFANATPPPAPPRPRHGSAQS